MSRRFRVGLLCAASVLSFSLVGASCGTKIDREGTKKLILKQLATANISDSDAQCVAKLLDGYSDKELKSLDDEFSKGKGEATSTLAKGFQSKTVDCMRGSATQAMIDALKKQMPNLTAEQEKCASDFFGTMSADDLTAVSNDTTKANEFGAKMAEKCLT